LRFLAKEYLLCGRACVVLRQLAESSTFKNDNVVVASCLNQTYKWEVNTK